MSTDEQTIPLTGNIELGEESVPTQKKGMMSLQLSNVAVREWLQKRRENVAPWSEFVNFAKFKVPKSVAPVGKRVMKNIDKFQSNYMFVFIALVVFCILTSPMLIIAIMAALGACYIINLKNAERKLTVVGKEISLAQQYAVVGVLCFPLFWVAGAGSAVFWVIGASFFVIMLHASMYSTEEELEDVELQMETV